jgi:hypothetical protein
MSPNRCSAKTALALSSAKRLDADGGVKTFLFGWYPVSFWWQFMFNAFGSIDNLAWVWVSEKELDIYKLRVGLGPNNIAVRKSLSAEFQEYLKGLDPWFAHLEDFRHALAHRISLYVPPYIITLDKETAYRDLEKRINEAAGSGNFQEYNKLLAEQTALGVFRPWMLHSTAETPGYVPFHPQLIADFNTIEELGRKMIDELRR